jgi:hypothetical protein
MHLLTEEAEPMLQFKAKKHQSATATAIEQAQLLIQEGYGYVTEMNGVKLFRKRK